MTELRIPLDEDKPRELPPAGLCNAVCCFVEDLGMQESTWKGEAKIKHELIIGFELEHTIKTPGDYEGKRFLLKLQETCSLSEKANLRRHLKSWRGKDIDKEDAANGGFLITSMVGKGATVNVIHGTSKTTGKPWAAIGGVMPMMPNNQVMIPEIVEIPEWVREAQVKGGVGVKPEPVQEFDPGSVPF